MKSFIDFFVEKRKNVKKIFEKNNFKLFMNSLYGKMIEDLFNRKDCELVCDENEFLKAVKKENYLGRKLFSENLAICNFQKKRVFE